MCGDSSFAGHFLGKVGDSLHQVPEETLEVPCLLDSIRSIASLVMTVPLASSSPIWQLIVMAQDLLNQVNYNVGWEIFACFRSVATLVMGELLTPSSPMSQLFVMAREFSLSSGLQRSM